MENEKFLQDSKKSIDSLIENNDKISEMINLLGSSKENFLKLLTLMKYKHKEIEKEIYFKYIPSKPKIKKIFKNKNKDDSPFKVLNNVNFN